MTKRGKAKINAIKKVISDKKKQNKAKAKPSLVRIFLKSISKQNIIIVLILFSFFVVNAFASTLKPKQINRIDPIPTPEKIEKPFLADPIQTPAPSPKLTAVPTPVPTLDPNLIVDCEIKPECGGMILKIKTDECFNKVCCQIGDKYESLDRDDCWSKQNEYEENERKEFEKKEQEKNSIFQDYLNKLKKNNEEQMIEREALESERLIREQENLINQNGQCKRDAINNYNQDKAEIVNEFANLGVIGGTGYGSYQWAIDQLNNQHQSIVDNCDYKYQIN